MSYEPVDIVDHLQQSDAVHYDNAGLCVDLVAVWRYHLVAELERQIEAAGPWQARDYRQGVAVGLATAAKLVMGEPT